LVAEQPDITLAEIKAVLATEKVTVGQSSISRFIHYLNLRFKKSLRAAEQDRPDVAAARKVLQKQQPPLELRHDRVTAPFVLEGPMTGEMFKAYTEQVLVPTLKRGDIVFMDNVGVHKVDGIEEAIEARGAIPFYLQHTVPT
jgi:hypothetical protein